MDIHATDGKASMSFNISDGTGQPVTVTACPLNQLSVKLTDNGIVVSNGPAGELTLTFPSLTADNKIIAGSDAGSAPDGKSLDLKYPGEATAHLALATKELTITFADLPQGTTAFRMLETEIPATGADRGRRLALAPGAAGRLPGLISCHFGLASRAGFREHPPTVCSHQTESMKKHCLWPRRFPARCHLVAVLFMAAGLVRAADTTPATTDMTRLKNHSKDHHCAVCRLLQAVEQANAGLIGGQRRGH